MSRLSSDADTPEDTETPPAADATSDDTQAPETDPVREGMLATLRDALGDDIVGHHVGGGDLWVRVKPEAWRRAAEACKTLLECDHFCFLSGIDWLPRDLKGEKVWDDAAAAEEAAQLATHGYSTGYAGGDTRFQVLARLQSTRRKWGITLKADLDESNPHVESWVTLYRGADWHERETWEMYGFTFDGHSGLRHIYLPSDFEGFPLRKDFPLLSREVKPWPGLVDVEPMPGDEEGEAAEGEEVQDEELRS